MPPVKFTSTDLLESVKDLATLRYFPHDSKASIMRELAAMCPDLEALRYVVTETLAATSDWPGLAELRGVLCNKYLPADGHEYWCTLPGLSAADNESKAILASQQLKAAGRNDWRLLADLAGADTDLRKRLGLATPRETDA